MKIILFKIVGYVFACVSIFSVSVIASADRVRLDKIIAVVNDEAVTLSEYKARYKRELLQTNRAAQSVPEDIDSELLQRLLDERIQSQVAQKQGIIIPELEINQMLDIMAQQNNISTTTLLDELAAQNISTEEIKRSIEEESMIRRVIDRSVNSRITVSEQEIDYHLQAHKELYAANEKYEISHLFVSVTNMDENDIKIERENLQSVRNKLQNGLSFSKAVEDYSDGDGVEDGYLGWRSENQLPELFLVALRNSGENGITEIIESGNGFHLLKIHAREGKFKVATQHLMRHILVQPGRRNISNQEAILFLNGLVQEIQNGANFGQLARLNSDDQASAAEGGELGWINPGEIAPDIESIVTRLPLNTLSGPIQSQFGFHLVEVLDRRKKDITQEIARKQAHTEVFKRKAAELYQSWLNILRDQAYIEYIAIN